MAYSEKYYITYCNTQGVECKVSILFDEYEGDSFEVVGQPVPFRKKYDGDWIFDPILPSTGNVHMVFGTGDGIDFEEFWQADEKSIKVEHWIGLALDWVGYVIPDGFSYAFTGGAYYASLRCADGLSTLENLSFAAPDGRPYGPQNLVYNNGFEFPFSLIATEILKKLDLNLNTYIGVDVFERSMTQGTNARGSDPLSQSYVNVSTFINDSDRKDIAYWQDPNTPMNCKEVMENLCNIFGAKVYQNKGRWQIKRVNININQTNKYFHIYNTANVHIGRELVGHDVNIPCKSITEVMIGDDHMMSMSEVYKAFRMNYKFTFKREGDNPVSLMTNGNFDIFNNSSKLAAPEGWVRWHDPGKWDVALRPVTLSPSDAGGNTTAILLGEQAPGMDSNNLDISAKPWRSLMHGPMQATKGDKLFFSLWQKTIPKINNVDNFYMIYRLALYPNVAFSTMNMWNATVPPTHYLVNKELSTGRQVSTQWATYATTSRNTNANIFSVWSDEEGLDWRKYDIEVPELPESGFLIFEIIGLYSYFGKSGKNTPYIQITYPKGNLVKLYTVRDEWWAKIPMPFPQVTGFEMGFIPDPSELPEKNYYLYENNKDYSFQVEPIEVLNGDTIDQKHISSIIVPSNVSGEKNFWNTQDGNYTPSSIGLITVKSIMQLFYRPFRLLEGVIKANEVTIDTRFTFEAIPGKKFMLKSAAFNEKKNYIEDAQFFEIAAEDEVLPPGGIEGGNTLSEIWAFTGNRRCRTVSGVNNGIVEVEQRNMNEASETYNNIRWISAGEDLDTCPIGDPSPYYWGCDDGTLNVANLTDFTFILEDGVVQCPFTNPGGLYIYFLHLDTLGVVENIFTDAQDRIISDFSYLSDVVVNGYTYKVLRQNYVTADFDNLPINFDFN